MSRARFRWTRKACRRAHWLARFMGRHLYELGHQPNLLRRYFELWDRHPQNNDPLLRSIQRRLNDKRDDPSIPF